MKHPELLAQLSLEEKAAFCSGKDFWHLNGCERLGLPEIMVSDGPHGLRKHNDKKDKTDLMGSVPAVCFPTASATACSWDEDLLYKMGQTLGDECRAEKVSVLLGPGMNHQQKTGQHGAEKAHAAAWFTFVHSEYLNAPHRICQCPALRSAGGSGRRPCYRSGIRP